MTNDEITKKDYLLDGQALDPNPTRARTFILGEGYVNTKQNSFTTTDPQKQRRMIESLKADYPQLTEEEIMDFY